MNKPLQTTIINSTRLNHLRGLVFSDALKIAESEENYEVCADLHRYITEKRKLNETLINKTTGKRIPMSAENFTRIFKITPPAEKSAKKMAEKMLLDNLIERLAETKAAPVVNDLRQMITELRTDLEPIKKALKFKINAESAQNWQNELRNNMKTQMVIKGGNWQVTPKKKV